MANPEHLEVLKQGVQQWNKWRGQHCRLLPDFSEADLRRADLRGADLGAADDGSIAKAGLIGPP